LLADSSGWSLVPEFIFHSKTRKQTISPVVTSPTTVQIATILRKICFSSGTLPSIAVADRIQVNTQARFEPSFIHDCLCSS